MRLTITHKITEPIEPGVEIKVTPDITFLVTGVIRRGKPRLTTDTTVESLCEYTVKVNKV